MQNLSRRLQREARAAGEDLLDSLHMTTILRSLKVGFQLTLSFLMYLGSLLLSAAPLLVGLMQPVIYVANQISAAMAACLFYSSVLLLSGRLLLLRKSLSTNGKLAIGMFTTYFLKPTIAMVIDYAKMNYRITRKIRKASHRTVFLLHLLLVLPVTFLQMFDLFALMFDTFRATFLVFFKVIEIGFAYVILIFRTYKTFVVCSAAIMYSMYVTAYYSILLVHSALAWLSAFTALLQHSAVRQALISYKEHKRRIWSSEHGSI